MLKRITLLFSLLLLVTSGASAQLPTGTWNGSVTPPNGDETAVTYDVGMSGDTISIVIHAGEHGDFPVSEAKLAGDTLSFRFQPGPMVDCRLLKQADGSFSGECIGEDGMSAAIVMTPPVKQEGPGN